MSVMITFRWDEEFVQRVDAARGLIPRTAFVKDLLERVLDVPAVLAEVPEKPEKKDRAKPAEKIEALEKIKKEAGLTTAAAMEFRQMCPQPTCNTRVPSPSPTAKCNTHSGKLIPYDAEAFSKREFS